MSKQLTPEEVSELWKSPYVVKIAGNRIAFSAEFKKLAYPQMPDGKTMRTLFAESGIPPELLGDSRTWSFANKLRKNVHREEGFDDLRDCSKRSPSQESKEQSLSARVEHLEHELAFTKQTVEFLKKFVWQIWRRRSNGNPGSARSEIFPDS